MECPKCGAKNEDTAAQCGICGAALTQAVPSSMTTISTVSTVSPSPTNPSAARPPNNLVFAIILTSFSVLGACCLPGVLLGLPFGIVSIIFANQVNIKYNLGDCDGARESAKKAGTWAWVSLGALFVGILLSIALIIALYYIGKNAD